MRHIFAVILITVCSVANAWEIDSICQKLESSSGQNLRIITPITMYNVIDKSQSFKLLYDIKCNLKTKECAGVSFNLASLDSKKIGLFDLNILNGLMVYSVEANLVVMKWGLNTFVFDDVEKSLVWMQDGAFFKGYGKAFCKQ